MWSTLLRRLARLGRRAAAGNPPRRIRPAVERLEDRSVPASLPPGFTETAFASGLSSPTAMEFAPDGRLFVTEKGGTVRVIANGTLLGTPFLTVAVNTNSERGLNGIAFDPAFATNGFVYVYYTAAAPVVNRLSRFTVSMGNANVADPGSEAILLDGIASTNGNHNGGALHFGTDGMLYVGVGEAGVPANSQDLGTLSGKVLRVNPAAFPGSIIPADNPFVGVGGARGEIWALGFRNPFTFAVQPGTGRIFINDVGGSRFEEINDLVRGGNHGWPICEGPCAMPGLVDPVHSYAHGSGAAITGGVFFPTGAFPAGLGGGYFFADFVQGFIRRLDLSVGLASPFVTNARGPVDLDVGPDGSLYYLSIFTGNVFRIQFTGGAERIVIGSLPGRPAQVRVLDAGSRRLLFTLQPYAEAFRGGLFVAAGDVNRDGFIDFVVAPRRGVGRPVVVFDGRSREVVFRFRAGGTARIRVAVQDVNGDGPPDIVIGRGPRGLRRLRAFDGLSGQRLLVPPGFQLHFSGRVDIA